LTQRQGEDEFPSSEGTMNMWILLGGLLIAVMIFIAGFAISFRAVQVARAKGYRHMDGAAVSIYFLFCGLFAWTAFFLWPSERLSPLPFVPTFILGMIVVCAAGALGVHAVAVLLPRRTSRTAVTSKARLPFTALGGVVLALTALASALLYFALEKPGVTPLRVFTVGIPAGFGLLGLGRRSRAPGAREVLQKDPRPPVLYLRAFSREKDVFAKVRNDGMDFVDRPAAERHNRTVEEFLGSAINASLGPFVAFGSPLDYVPPDGAARLYAADDRWENEFLDLAGRARILLTVPQYSSNLVHELQVARRRGWLHKVRILTRPTMQLTRIEELRWTYTAWLLGPEIRQRLAGHDWEGFLQALNDAGLPSPTSTRMLDGSVLAFASDGSLLPVRTALSTPEEFVAALGEPLSNDDDPVQLPTVAPRQPPRNPRKAPPRPAYAAALAFVVLTLGLVAKSIPASVAYFETALRAAPVLSPGTRVSTKSGAGVMSESETRSVPVIIEAGHTGIVRRMDADRDDLVLVSWDPQRWEQYTWAAMWGIPGLHGKRYVALERFESTINVDWVEAAPVQE
jgi:hypothetical protein